MRALAVAALLLAAALTVSGQDSPALDSPAPDSLAPADSPAPDSLPLSPPVSLPPDSLPPDSLPSPADSPAPGDGSCTVNPPSVVNGLWDWDCIGTKPGETCAAWCKPGFKSDPQPSAVCVGGEEWTGVQGGCLHVCAGAPPIALKNGRWPAACTDRTRTTDTCEGECNDGYHGKPTILCNATKQWDSVIVGQCAALPVCAGVPEVEIDNGRFPKTCTDTMVGKICKAVCNAGFIASKTNPPTLACVNAPRDSTTGMWAAAPRGSCDVVCPGMPSPYLLGSAGAFPDTCMNSVAVGETCTGYCDEVNDYVGTPSVKCLPGGEWASELKSGCTRRA